MPIHTDNRSLGQMFADLSRETRTLIQQEIQLTKTELGEKVSRMRTGALLVVAGALLAYGGLLALMAAAILALLTAGLSAWAAALVAGGAAALIGCLFMVFGLSALRPRDLAPRHTIETLKEDALWLRRQTR